MNTQALENSVIAPRPSATAPPRADADAPVGAWGHVRRWSAEFWLWYLFWNARHFPWYARSTKWFFLWFAWRGSPTLREPTLANAGRLLGPGSTPAQRRHLAKSVLSNFYDFVEDIGSSLHKTPEQLCACIEETTGQDHYNRARAAGRGAIVVTAHLGSFEVGAAGLRRRESAVYVVFRRDTRQFFEVTRSRMRRRLGVIEAPIEGGLHMWMGLRDALRRDAVVVMQGDRVMPGHRGLAVPFLGGHMLMPVGPLKLAAATGAPLIPVFTVRTGPHRFRVCIEEPIYCDAAQLAIEPVPPPLLALASVIEKYVRAYPQQWMVLQPALCEDTPPPPVPGPAPLGADEVESSA